VTVFYVYSCDRGPQNPGDLEFCGDLAVPQYLI